MATYTGLKRRAGPRLFWAPICFTNKEKAAFWAIAVVGEGANGGLLGLVAGIVVASVTAAPVAATGIGAALGALIGTTEVTIGLVVGGIAGVCYGFWLAWRSACPECGSCIEILLYQTFFPISLIAPLVPVVPLIVRPSTRDCSIIPPGCP